MIGRVAILALAAGCAAGAQSGSAGMFERLKALAGTWEADSPAGGKLSDTIALVSDGTAISETIGIPADNELSIYTRGADQIAMTHYCALTQGGHQAHLQARVTTAGASEFVFTFVSAENLPAPAAAHMRRMVLRLEDSSHFSEVWTKREAGKDRVFTLNFVRR
jgi:hypothetical protein